MSVDRAQDLQKEGLGRRRKARVVPILAAGLVLGLSLYASRAAVLQQPETIQPFGVGAAEKEGDKSTERTVAAANDEAVPAFVLTAALFERFASRGEDDFQNRVLSAMRFGFGGHVEKK